MDAKILLLALAVFLIGASASAYCGSGYYCSGYSTGYGYAYERYTPYDYYSQETWPGYTSWEYFAPNGRYYSYYGPSYYGHYGCGNYSYYGHDYYAASEYYYYPAVTYYHAPYYNYYDYSMQYYSPGFSVSMAW